MIKTLLFSTLYPSSIRPTHGIFVETRLRELLKTGQVETKVISPVPWFPLKHRRFGEYSDFAKTPTHEIISGIEIFRPRYFLPPKIGMGIAPFSMARAAISVVRKVIDQGFDFDLIDAHYYYPDGVAVAMISQEIGKPFIVTARGTDLNLIADYNKPRRLILDAARAASASIGVCQALMDRLFEMGADPAKLHVLRNGVDLDRFHPIPQIAARNSLGLPQDEKVMLSVGHLIERKGHHIAIEAVASLPGFVLIIIGSGPELANLKVLAASLGVSERVQFIGHVANTELKWWYSAADLLTLCSSREGWANVLLESMACGTPVIATKIWGTPEIVTGEDAGILIERNPPALIQAVYRLINTKHDRLKTRKYAEAFSWDATTIGQIELMKRVIE